MPEFGTGGVRRRNTVRILVAPPRRPEVDLGYVMLEVFFKCFGVDAGRMFCVQDFPKRGLYDFMLESEALCLEVFERFKVEAGKKTEVLAGIAMEPLFPLTLNLLVY